MVSERSGVVRHDHDLGGEHRGERPHLGGQASASSSSMGANHRREWRATLGVTERCVRQHRGEHPFGRGDRPALRTLEWAEPTMPAKRIHADHSTRACSRAWRRTTAPTPARAGHRCCVPDELGNPIHTRRGRRTQRGEHPEAPARPEPGRRTDGGRNHFPRTSGRTRPPHIGHERDIIEHGQDLGRRHPQRDRRGTSRTGGIRATVIDVGNQRSVGSVTPASSVHATETSPSCRSAAASSRSARSGRTRSGARLLGPDPDLPRTAPRRPGYPRRTPRPTPALRTTPHHRPRSRTSRAPLPPAATRDRCSRSKASSPEGVTSSASAVGEEGDTCPRSAPRRPAERSR